MKFLAKIAHGFLSLTIFAKGLFEILNTTGNTWMLLFVHKTARFVIVNNDINLSFFTWLIIMTASSMDISKYSTLQLRIYPAKRRSFDTMTKLLNNNTF